MSKLKTILLTGGAGFVGSHLIQELLKLKRYQIINLDLLTYAGNLDNLKGMDEDPLYHFVHGDIREAELVEKIFLQFKVDHIIHLAAESHVDNSLKKAMNFASTNIMGTFVLLEVAKKHFKGGSRFLHVSPDEVYGSLGEAGKFTETTPYSPNSPYSATKAGSDFLVRSYGHSVSLDYVISHCSNNYGPKQHDEKLIPTILRNALGQKSIPLYGDGKNVRDWLHVRDHCQALIKIFEAGTRGETYNIGADCEKTNLELCHKILDILDHVHPRPKGSYHDLISFVNDRPGHDFRYAIDASKIQRELGWKALNDFDQGLLETVQWYCIKYTT